MKYPKISLFQFFIFIITSYLFILSVSYLWRNYFTTSNKAQSQRNQKISWQREEELDVQKGISIRWNIENENIYMNVTGKTKGWLGIGFSSSNAMTATDIVIGWIKDGKPYLQDRYFLDTRFPFLDEKQDYELIEGEERDEFTSFYFKRKLDTCDSHDYKIKKEFVNVIWATNEEDPIDNPVFHNSSRGSKKIFLFSSKPESSPHTNYIDFTNKEETLNNDPKEYYSCSYFKVQKFAKQKHLIGVAPLVPITNTKAVRYINVFECNIDEIPILETTNCFDFSVPPFKKCFQLFVRWTSGSDKQFLPSNIGISFPKSKVYHMQIYYNFTNTYGVKRDDSGIRLFFSESFRPMEANILEVSYSTSHRLLIPPYQKEYIVMGFCDSECTKATFPPEGTRIFGFSFFSKEIGTKMKLRHFRGNNELEPIIDDHFNTYLQDVVFLKEPIQHLPEDRLVLECKYDSSHRTVSTLGIYWARSEACKVFIYYYPAVPLAICQSQVNDVNYDNLNLSMSLQRDLFNLIAEEFLDYRMFARDIIQFNDRYVWPKYLLSSVQVFQNDQLPICKTNNQEELQSYNKMTLPTVTPYDGNANCKQ